MAPKKKDASKNAASRNRSNTKSTAKERPPLTQPFSGESKPTASRTTQSNVIGAPASKPNSTIRSAIQRGQNWIQGILASAASASSNAQSSNLAHSPFATPPPNKVKSPTIAPLTSVMKKELESILKEQVLTPEQYRKQSQLIAQSLLSSSASMTDPNFTKTTPSDLRIMAELYDAVFFGSKCIALAKNYGMAFRWSSRMTRAGGKTTRFSYRASGGRPASQKFEITLSSSLLFQTFQDESREVRVCGCVCHNRLEAMQRVVEHELTHLGEMLVWTDSDCAAGRFQAIANRMFGHTEHRHDLVTQRERAMQLYDIRVGSRVRFKHEGKFLSGVVNRITRRATILVESTEGVLYNDGKRYVKFYVPIASLKRN